MEDVGSILLKNFHSFGPKFESQFIRRWIVYHFEKILRAKNFSDGFCQNVRAEKIEYKKLFLSIESAVWRDHAKFQRDKILDVVNSIARDRFASRESIVVEIVFHSKKLPKKFENQNRDSKLEPKIFKRAQVRIETRQKIRSEIRKFLRQKPWAIYSEVLNSISKKFPREFCTPQLVNRTRIELIQILARKLTIKDQNRPDAKTLTMLKLQIPPALVNEEKIRRVFQELRYDFAHE